MSPPTDIEVLDALRLLRSYFVAAESSALYSQRDLPPGCASRSAYVRRHRALRAAGVQGVRAIGKTRRAWGSPPGLSQGRSIPRSASAGWRLRTDSRASETPSTDSSITRQAGPPAQRGSGMRCADSGGESSVSGCSTALLIVRASRAGALLGSHALPGMPGMPGMFRSIKPKMSVTLWA